LDLDSKLNGGAQARHSKNGEGHNVGPGAEALRRFTNEDLG